MDLWLTAGALADSVLNFWMDLLRDIEVCFTRNLDGHAVLRTYWFLFFIEFPRYYLLEALVTLSRIFTRSSRLKQRDKARVMLYTEHPLVSVIVPGKNEGSHIYKLVESLREQTYRNIEVIVIDDGSDDATPLFCHDLEKHGHIDRFIRMNERGGKASAANAGLYFCKGKYVVHLDADSSLDNDAVENILLPFYLDPNIKAVGGCVKVRNMWDTICTSLQALEYLKTIMVGRMVTSTLGIYHIISGAFGAFDRETLTKVGGWDIGPGLDGDITQKIRKAGYQVTFAREAVCMTNVPTRWHQLYKQRKRWSRSLVRFRLRKHSDILLPDRNFQFVNWASNMEGILYDFVFNYVWLWYIINLFFSHTERLLEVLVVGWLIRYVFSLMAYATIMAVTERKREEWLLFFYLPLSTFYTGYFLRLARLVGHTSEVFYFSSYKDKWNPRKTSIIAQAEHQ